MYFVVILWSKYTSGIERTSSGPFRCILCIFFLKNSVAFCTGFNLLTLIFMLPYIIMDLPIFMKLSLKMIGWKEQEQETELSINHL